MRPQPISTNEFSRLWIAAKSKRPVKNLAVAFSGGADSLCLLFLLHRHLQSHPSVSMLSLIVDHKLQESSTATAKKCSVISEAMGVPHVIAPIQWSSPPFPSKPSPGTPFEEIARDARYNVMLAECERHRIDTVLMGHHADDQVETVLMRMMQRPAGNADRLMLGYGGMKRMRRWGMGQGQIGDLRWAGMQGMQTSICRPLLDVSKDRIYATCEANGLEWIEDATNFQPGITLRNAIRASLAGKHSNLPVAQSTEIASTISRATAMAAQAVPRTSSNINLLRSWVTNTRDEVDKLEAQATSFIQTYTRASPPSTLLLLTSHLPPNFSSPHNTLLHHSIILKILRAISPAPWGSPKAEAGRETSRLQQLASQLFSSTPTTSTLDIGGSVSWKRVYLYKGNILQNKPAGVEDCRWGWLASRAPPRRFDTSTSTYSKQDPLMLDVSELCFGQRTVEKSILWDNRFLIRIKPGPMELFLLARYRKWGKEVRMHIASHSQWVLPRLQYTDICSPPLPLLEVSERGPPKVSLPWCSIELVRPLE